MRDPDRQAERDLRLLGKRVRRGWAKLHPLMAKELETVREVVRQQWEIEKGKSGQVSLAKTQQKAPAEPAPEQRQEKSQHKAVPPPQGQPPSEKNKDQGWGHSH